MKACLAALIATLACVPVADARDPALPLADGDYAFQHREAEHPAMPAEQVRVRIAGDRILVFNDKPARWMPRGLVTQGHLRWNAPNKAWVIAKTEADADAKEAGHCSDGPDIVDLEKRIWWTC